jgi:hypothetical protein
MEIPAANQHGKHSADRIFSHDALAFLILTAKNDE